MKMEIERINDYTVKFKIPYADIEERGYTKEEIWYNRDKGEELFWDILDEAALHDEFSIEGPLWIQVQASEKGIEVTVTRAQLSKDAKKLEVPINNEQTIQLPLDEQIENLLEQQLGNVNPSMHQEEEKVEKHFDYSIILTFRDIEDIIDLSHRIAWDGIETSLYQFEDVYYLHLKFDDFLFEEDGAQLIISLGLEYGSKTKITIHRLQEYGKCIAEKNAMQVVHDYFPER